MFFNKKKEDPNTDLNFLGHLEALRWHLVRVAIAIFLFATAAFIHYDILFDKILFGPLHTDFITYQWMCKLSENIGIDLCVDQINFSVINLNISGQFIMHMKGAFIAGLVLSFPYLLWEIWRFIKPALKMNELRYTRGVVFFGSILFLAGVSFGYFIISPLSVQFLGNYQVSQTVANQISLDSYISTVTMLTLASGIVFEMPIIVFFLSSIGMMTPEFMNQYRKHSMIVILIIAALITPSPDVASQMLVALPLFVLYEVSIWVRYGGKE